MFSVEESALNDGFNKDNVDGWDSVHQLSITSSIEDEFDIMLDAEDILNATSYVNVLHVLEKFDLL